MKQPQKLHAIGRIELIVGLAIGLTLSGADPEMWPAPFFFTHCN